MAYGVNAPFGLQPRQYLNGSLWTGQIQEYIIKYTYPTRLFTGDPVTMQDDGTIVLGSVDAAAGGLSGWIGVFQGVKYRDATNTPQFSPYWAAGTPTFQNSNPIALIADDPNILFDVQTNGGLMAQTAGAYGITLPDLNYNFAISTATAGSTISGQSGVMVDNTTEGTGATLPLKLIRLTPIPNNVFGGTSAAPNYNNGLFLINNHKYKGGTGTLGI